MTMQATTIEIPPSPKLVKLSGDADYFRIEATALVVSTDTLPQASDLLGLMKAALGEIEEQRVWLTKPLNEHVKGINAKAKAIAEPIMAADLMVRGKVTAFHVAERRRFEEERRRQEAAELERLAAEAARIDAETPDDEPVEAPPPPAPVALNAPPKTVRSSMATTSMRDVWKWEIADETKIPREYLMIDEKKLNAVVRAGIRQIEGVRIFKTQELAVR